MRCVICKQGDTKPGHVTVTLERDGAVMIFKKVPADICVNCREYYLADNVTNELLVCAEEAIRQGVELKIARFAA